MEKKGLQKKRKRERLKVQEEAKKYFNLIKKTKYVFRRQYIIFFYFLKKMPRKINHGRPIAKIAKKEPQEEAKRHYRESEERDYSKTLRQLAFERIARAEKRLIEHELFHCCDDDDDEVVIERIVDAPPIAFSVENEEQRIKEIERELFPYVMSKEEKEDTLAILKRGRSGDGDDDDVLIVSPPQFSGKRVIVDIQRVEEDSPELVESDKKDDDTAERFLKKLRQEYCLQEAQMPYLDLSSAEKEEEEATKNQSEKDQVEEVDANKELAPYSSSSSSSCFSWNCKQKDDEEVVPEAVPASQISSSSSSSMKSDGGEQPCSSIATTVDVDNISKISSSSSDETPPQSVQQRETLSDSDNDNDDTPFVEDDATTDDE